MLNFILKIISSMRKTITNFFSIPECKAKLGFKVRSIVGLVVPLWATNSTPTLYSEEITEHTVINKFKWLRGEYHFTPKNEIKWLELSVERSIAIGVGALLILIMGSFNLPLILINPYFITLAPIAVLVGLNYAFSPTQEIIKSLI